MTEEIPWVASDEPPESAPGDNEIHLWSTNPGLAQADESLLDASEQWRSLKMAPQRRREFIVGRCVLRRVLAGYLDLPPRAIKIKISSNGKPSLAAPRQLLHFSLAHCSTQLMIAFSRTPVGLDIETPRAVKNCLGIAARLFQPEQIRQLESIAGDQQQQKFFHLWTAYEAAQKMHGEGLFGKHTAASFSGKFMLGDGSVGAVCSNEKLSAAVEVSCFEHHS